MTDLRENSFHVSRHVALDLAASALYTGVPMHPAMRDRLREIIGETTAAEEEHLRSARLAGEATAERSREQMRILAETSERFRRNLARGDG